MVEWLGIKGDDQDKNEDHSDDDSCSNLDINLRQNSLKIEETDLLAIEYHNGELKGKKTIDSRKNSLIT